MVQRPLKSLLLGRAARWLEHVSGLLSRQAERWTAAARGREATGELAVDEVAPREDGSPQLPQGPPAHWLARVQQSGQPLRWIEHRGGPAPDRPAGRQPPGAPARGPQVPQRTPPPVERSAASEARPRTGTPLPAADLPQPPFPQEPDRAQAEEAAGHRPPRSSHPTHPAERPVRLIPRPPSAQKADTEAPTGEAPRPQVRLWGRPRERPETHPPAEAEAPETGPGPQEDGPVRRSAEHPAVTVAARSAQPHEETPVARQPVVPQESPLQASRPTSTMQAWRTGPMEEGEQEADTHPLGSQTVGIRREGDRVLDGVKGSRQPAWPSLDQDRRSQQIVTGPAAEAGVRGAGIESIALVRAGESAHVKARSAIQETHRDGTRRRTHEQDQLWEETPPEDRWPSLPESTYPGSEAPEALAEEAWSAQLRAWQRLRRLDEEQRGNLWSASPF